MNKQAKPKLKNLLPILLIGIAILAIVIFWWQLSPPGLMGKARAIGLAVCNQLPSHSFMINENPFPICSRCTGMYLGNFIGMLVLFSKGKRAGVPSRNIILILIAFAILWAFDGLNSFLTNLNGKNLVYTTNNTIRLLTGFGMGLSMSSATVTIFNLTMWTKYTSKPVIASFSQFIALVILALLFALLVLIQNEILLTIFAYIATGTIVVLLTTLYAILWMIIFKRENSCGKVKDLIPILMAGFLTTMIQITLFDLMRITLYGN